MKSLINIPLLTYSCLFVVLHSGVECADERPLNIVGESDISIVSNGHESANDNNWILVPSFLVNGIYLRLKSNNSFESVAPTYMNGYSKELAQIITKNMVADFRIRRDIWFRNGAEDATKLVGEILKSGKIFSYDVLGRFGYQKVRIKGVYNILHQLEYGNDGNVMQTYATKEIQDRLEKEVVSKGSSIHAILSGWVSPLGTFDSESIMLPRILVVESADSVPK